MNNERERTIICRDGKPIEFTRNTQNIFSVRRVDLNVFVGKGFSITPEIFDHRFHCSDCSFLVGCTVENSLSNPESIATYRAEGLQGFRSEAFSHLILEPAVESPPRNE